VIVFDDGFGVSDDHLDVIPIHKVEDVTALTKDDLPLLKIMQYTNSSLLVWHQSLKVLFRTI